MKTINSALLAVALALPASAEIRFYWSTTGLSNSDLIQVYGIRLLFTDDATINQSAAYRHQKTGPGSYKRWDGSAGLALDSVMGAVTASGIRFVYSD